MFLREHKWRPWKFANKHPKFQTTSTDKYRFRRVILLHQRLNLPTHKKKLKKQQYRIPRSSLNNFTVKDEKGSIFCSIKTVQALSSAYALKQQSHQPEDKRKPAKLRSSGIHAPKQRFSTARSTRGPAISTRQSSGTTRNLPTKRQSSWGQAVPTHQGSCSTIKSELVPFL